ncbi:MAG: 23S rRNA (guanosine(2251)-2'-O)-methyltransferase RlmB [Oscillospiraceae bacterium]|nr:23S rRNA (guanosine(2251)-2'-O)-methyltransferase RlmB [Oscillospiraceae bacterium]
MNTDNNNLPLFVYGRNAVAEYILSGRVPTDIFTADKAHLPPKICDTVETAKNLGATVKKISAEQLDTLCRKHDPDNPNVRHGGIAALFPALPFADFDDIRRSAESRYQSGGLPPLYIICDSINDPRNLGAIIRTAECAGADAVVIPKHGSVGLTAETISASAGAAAYLPVCRVSNLSDTIRKLKASNVWVYAADNAPNAARYDKTDYSGAAALVIGSEGNGVSPLVLKNCDVIIKIPQYGRVNSLNASAAAAVLIFEIARTRCKDK